MPHVKLDTRQFIEALEERMREANASVVLANVAAAFQHYADANEGRAEMFPDVASDVAGKLRDLADATKVIECGKVD